MVAQLCKFIKGHWIVKLKNEYIVWYVHYTSRKLSEKKI